MPELNFLPDDLAPGDQRILPLDLSPLTLVGIRDRHHPLFEAAYARLWREFGSLNEMESREVLATRFAWYPVSRHGDRWFRYEMALVRRGEESIAVRDHVAIVSQDSEGPCAVVHLSHVLVEPEWRRTGVAAWLRAVPIQTARACLCAAGFPEDSPITLVAEMEHPDPTHEMRSIRLKAYERAGFRKIDPRRIDYHQPDFRSPEAIDTAGGSQPVPFTLIVRRVGREEGHEMPSAEVKHIISSLYGMYATGVRAQDMQGLWRQLEGWPKGSDPVSLFLPTSGLGPAPEL